jgi:hypothetical protein
MDMAALCHERRECESAIGFSRYAEATNDDGSAVDGPSRFESMYHRLCMPDSADSTRYEGLFRKLVTVRASACDSN